MFMNDINEQMCLSSVINVVCAVCTLPVPPSQTESSHFLKAKQV